MPSGTPYVVHMTSCHFAEQSATMRTVVVIRA